MLTVEKQRELFERNAWQYKNVEKIGFREFLYRVVSQLQYGGRIKQDLPLQQVNRSEYRLVKFLYDNFEFHWCYLSRKRIAQRMKVSRWTVYTAVAHLVEIGVVELEKEQQPAKENAIIGIRLIKQF